MNFAALIAAAFGGFVSGTLVWTQATRWVALLYVSGKKEGGDFLGAPKRRLLWVMPFVALLHPAPWILGAIVYLVIRAIRDPVPEAWLWALGGFGLCFAFLVLTTAAIFVRRRPG